MLVNTSQQIDRWNEYFPEVVDDPNKLGILINMFNIGSVVSFFIVPYMADEWGRKPTIVVGSVFMVGGALISAFCNGYGSKSLSSIPLLVSISEERANGSSVHGRAFCPWLWQLHVANGITGFAHGDLPPSAPRASNRRLQLSLEHGIPQ